jgi:hypothetical protein
VQHVTDDVQPFVPERRTSVEALAPPKDLATSASFKAGAKGISTPRGDAKITTPRGDAKITTPRGDALGAKPPAPSVNEAKDAGLKAGSSKQVLQVGAA